MKKILVIISLFLSGGISMSQELNDPIWSKPINGLQARIIFKYNKNMIFNDTPIITAYLELQNVSDIANPMKIKWSNGDNIHFNLIDNERRRIPPSSGLPYNEKSPILEELILPLGSTLKFIISHHGAGVPKSEKVVIDFGSYKTDYIWIIKKRDEKDYFLKAVFEIKKSTESNINDFWYGKIEIPEVKIPENE